MLQMKDQHRDLNAVAGARQTPGRASETLRVAIAVGDLCMCKRIVQQGVDLDAGYQDCNGCTPLLYSLQLNQTAIVEYLALEGAAPAGKICHHFNPSGLSIFLLERHPNQYLHLTDPIHPFHLAIVFQAIECVSLMIRHVVKGRPSSKAHELSMRLTTLTEGASTLAASHHYAKGRACHLANLRVGTLDASFGRAILGSNDTPLKLATVVQNHKIARLLLEAGRLVDEGDLTHNTPLHLAASLGDGEMVELLLELGANPQVQNDYLGAPTMLAAGKGHLQAL